MAKVSIIIPTYNVEMYLVECMESVVNQTLKDIEIICINDGSTDGSLEILKSYAQKDDRIVLVDKENGGYGIGMNIGLDKATGEYIGIVEPDDFIPLNMYSDLYEKAVENDLDFIKADFYRFKRDSETEDMELVYNHLSPNKEDYNIVFNPSETPKAIRYIMNTWSGIYKRSFIEEFHIRHNETPGASFQDNGFWFQTFAYAKRGMIIDKPYYMNRRDNPNSSVHNKEKVYCMNVEYDHIRELLVRDKEVWERIRSMYWLKKYNMFIGYNCRITAFDLLKDYVKIGKNVKTDTTELFMDSDALKNSPYQKYNKKDTKKFEALYSSVNTVYSTNTDKHISVFKKYRKKNDINFANDKTKASLITVVFHSSFSKKENELFIGHAGVLVPLKNKKYIFIEKLSFQSPYQVIKFESKQQLNEYLMRMYDTEWGQDTAKPFIMENNDVLSCYHSVR